MDYEFFINPADLYNKTLNEIPVFQGCRHVRCDCGKCDIKQGTISREMALEFFNNIKSPSEWLSENMEAKII
jgi:hypothetical protein